METAEERTYSQISVQVTLATLAVEEARENYNQYRYSHTIPTADVVARLAELRGEVELAERELQKLLPAFAEAKSKINGWR